MIQFDEIEELIYNMLPDGVQVRKASHPAENNIFYVFVLGFGYPKTIAKIIINGAILTVKIGWPHDEIFDLSDPEFNIDKFQLVMHNSIRTILGAENARRIIR